MKESLQAYPWQRGNGISSPGCRTWPFFIVVATVLLGACGAPQNIRLPPGASYPAAVAVDRREDGLPAKIDGRARMTGYIESARASDFCPDGVAAAADQRCVVTRGWDYTRGVTLIRTFDPSRRQVGEQVVDGADLSLVPAEDARVEALMRADPRLAGIVNRPTIKVWSGGFVFRQPGDPYCDRGSRCIHAIAAANHGDDDVAHAVVDLVTDRVVYPFYKPAVSSAATTLSPGN